MKVSQKICTSGRKLLEFFLPVYKPAGMCCLRLGEAIRLDMYMVLSHHKVNYNQILLNNCHYLEPFANGIVTFAVGRYTQSKQKNFVLAEYEHELTIEFGVDREYSSADGAIIEHCNTQHITEESILKQLNNFRGTIEQDRLNAYRYLQPKQRDPMELLRNPDWEPGLNHIDIMNQIILPPTKKEIRPPATQKYPHIKSKRTANVKSLELVAFCGPFAEFRIISDGSFKPRQFARDLSRALDTKGSLIKMRRKLEGPLSDEDLMVLQTYELHLDYYVDRLDAYNRIYKEFNEHLDPLWADIKT